MRRLTASCTAPAFSRAFAQTTLDITLPGASCAPTRQVPSQTAASGHLQATATSSTGPDGSGESGNVTFGPATPVVATPVPIIQRHIVDQLSSAECEQVYRSITGNGSFTGGTTLCFQVPAVVRLRSARLQQFDDENAATQAYTVSVTCTGTIGQATSQTTVNVPEGRTPPGCFAGDNSAGGQFAPYDRQHSDDAPDDSIFVARRNQFHLDLRPELALRSPHLGVIYLPVPTDKFLSLAFKVPEQFSLEWLQMFM